MSGKLIKYFILKIFSSAIQYVAFSHWLYFVGRNSRPLLRSLWPIPRLNQLLPFSSFLFFPYGD